jgi:molybdopterin-dependent oxidoreductase alpha subunit
VNLLLLRGNIGRQGAGICPVRGHSNVQGQRTVGITEKPKLAPLDKLKELYHFEPPRALGLTTVKTCEGVISGEVKAFIGLGGNFLRAAPDTARLEEGWRRLRFTVQVATKLNRSHVVHGEVAYLLPCLGRSEFDHQASGVQVVTTEDSTGHMHASHAVAEPASPLLMSEVAIVAAIARRTLPANPYLHWNEWTADYGTIRDAIGRTWPEIFHDFNARMDTPGGFPRPNAARERQWKTENGKANFTVPARWTASSDDAASDGEGVLRLVTVRSDDQFNTTVYSDEDRLRRVQGRDVVLMNGEDMAAAGLEPGSRVDLATTCRAVAWWATFPS